jgi:hypothetical protein
LHGVVRLQQTALIQIGGSRSAAARAEAGTEPFSGQIGNATTSPLRRCSSANFRYRAAVLARAAVDAGLQQVDRGIVPDARRRKSTWLFQVDQLLTW